VCDLQSISKDGKQKKFNSKFYKNNDPNINSNVNPKSNKSDLNSNVNPKSNKSDLNPNVNDLNSCDYGVQLMLKKIGEKSAGYKWMHKQEQFDLEKTNGRYQIIEIILLAILGALTSGEFIGLLADSGLRENNTGIIVISGIELFFLTIYSVVKSLRENGDYQTLTWQNKYMSSKFSEINMDIQEQISLKTSNVPFLRQTIKLYNQLLENSTTIQQNTIQKYIEGTQDINIYKPLIMGNFDQIEIIISNGDNDNNQNTKNNNQNTNQNINKNTYQNSNKNNKDNTPQTYENKIKYELERYLKNM
jgi:hypothetical protein